jgi:hypothetical protein
VQIRKRLVGRKAPQIRVCLCGGARRIAVRRWQGGEAPVPPSPPAI